MPIINLKILGSTYQVACNTGEEHNLYEFAEILSNDLKELSKKSPTASDNKLLILNSLIMLDKISELKNNIPVTPNNEDIIAKTLDTVTEYIENLAKKLEKL